MEETLASGSDALPAPDTHYLNGGWGWLELGNPTEALAELERISAGSQSHPEVLMLRWEILGTQGKWEEALEVGQRLVQLAPERSESWIKQSFALHELKRTQEAWDALMPVAESFPEVSTIPYNLACYACVLEQFNAAMAWLRRAIKVGGKRSVREMALKDPDLRALWYQIERV
jgi:Flp pilus assembly protein TadD